jgi:hypothetical protein
VQGAPPPIHLAQQNLAKMMEKFKSPHEEQGESQDEEQVEETQQPTPRVDLNSGATSSQEPDAHVESEESAQAPGIEDQPPLPLALSADDINSQAKVADQDQPPSYPLNPTSKTKAGKLIDQAFAKPQLERELDMSHAAWLQEMGASSLAPTPRWKT